MRYFKFILIIIILSSFQPIEAENNDEYKIEIVLFNFNTTSTDELFKTNLDEPDINETIEFYDNELINTASKYSKFENISSYISSIIEYQYNKEKTSYPSTWYRESDNLEILENFKNNISKDNNLKLRAQLFSDNGEESFEHELIGKHSNASLIGRTLGEKLLNIAGEKFKKK